MQKGHGPISQKGCDSCGISQKAGGWSLLSGVHQKGVEQKGIVQKGIVQKGIEQKGHTQKGITQKGFDPFGILQKGHHQKGHFQKGHHQKGWSLGPIHQKGIHQKGYGTYGGYHAVPQHGCSDCGVASCSGCRPGIVPRAIHGLGGLFRHRLHSPVGHVSATCESHEVSPFHGDSLMPDAVNPFTEDEAPQPTTPSTTPSQPQGSRLSSARAASHSSSRGESQSEPTPAKRQAVAAKSEMTSASSVRTDQRAVRTESSRPATTASEPELFRLIGDEVRKLHENEAPATNAAGSVRRVSSTGAQTVVVPHNPLRNP